MNIIKVCGINSKCNCNFDINHVKQIVDMCVEKYSKDLDNIILMEIIAGMTFAITGNFELILDENSTIMEDEIKTRENIKNIYYYLNKRLVRR